MKKKLAAILLMLSLLIGLLGCGPFYEYSQVNVRVENLCGPGWLASGTLAATVVDGNTYQFNNQISEQERADFIKNQQKICGFLSENGIDASGLNFYVLKNIESRAVGAERTAYVDVSVNKSVSQILFTLQAALGEYTNYGYLYALSNHIAEELQWQNDEIGSVDAGIFQASSELLNLTYPCFTEQYVTPDQLLACKALAQSIFDAMQNPFAGESEFQDQISDYAQQAGIDFAPTYLTFAYGGDCCPLKIRTKYLDVYLDSDYEGSCDLSEQSILDDPMFHLDSIIEFFAYSDEQLTKLRETFGHESDDLLPVYVCELNYRFAGGDEYAGLWDGSCIRLASIYTLTHEYTHYLDYSVDPSYNDDIDWCTETLACYFGRDMVYMDRLVRAKYGADLTVEALSDLLGQTFDSIEDEVMFQNVMVAYEENPRYALISLYNGRLSFGAYFVETYGEEAFIECMFAPNASNVIVGYKIDEIVDDWCIWLEQFKILDRTN